MVSLYHFHRETSSILVFTFCFSMNWIFRLGTLMPLDAIKLIQLCITIGQNRRLLDEVFMQHYKYVGFVIWSAWLQRSNTCPSETWARCLSLHYLHHRSVVLNAGLLKPTQGLSFFCPRWASAAPRGSMYSGGLLSSSSSSSLIIC